MPENESVNEQISDEISIEKLDEVNDINLDQSLLNTSKKIMADYYSGNLQPSAEEFLKLKGLVDKFIEELSRQINFEEINQYCEVNIDTKNPSPNNYVELLSTVSEYNVFFIDKAGLLENFLKTYDKYIDLLKVYLLLLSGKKKNEAEPEITIKLKDYLLKRQIYDGIYSKVKTKKEVFENKYTVLSRILAFWEKELNASSSFSRSRK